MADDRIIMLIEKEIAEASKNADNTTGDKALYYIGRLAALKWVRDMLQK